MGFSCLRRWLARLSAVLSAIVACFACTAVAAPFDMAPIRIGVLAFRPVNVTLSQWLPTANYLEVELKGRPVTMVPLTLENIEQAVAGHQIDFLLANPEQYVLLASRHRLAAVATLLTDIDGRPVSQFGGVIFVRAERGDMALLPDIDGKTIAAVSQKSFAGFLAQRWTLHQAGVDLLRRSDRLLFTGLPQDKVVQEVLAGRADVGFVRTGVLESLEREGKLIAGELRVLNRQPANRFPRALSTDLFPEWPLAVMPGVPDAVTKEVTMALFRLPAGHPATRAAEYYGFAPPGDYASVEALLHRLHLHPDRLQYFGLSDIGVKYAPGLIGGALFVLLLIAVLIYRFAAQNRRLTKALDRAERLALRDDLLNSLSEGVYGVDAQGLCTFINPAALTILGYSKDEVVGQDQHALFHHHYPDGRDYPAVQCPIRQTLSDGRLREGEEFFFGRDGGMVPVWIGVQPIWQDGRVAGAVVAFRDITALKEAEAQIQALALHDELTGLPNRRLLNDRLEMALAHAAFKEKFVVVLRVDLDGLKRINQQYGHDAGDRALVEIARRLQAELSPVDTLARTGGNKFAVVLADVPSVVEAREWVEKTAGRIGEPVADGEQRHYMLATIGMALFPKHGGTSESLLQVADRGLAMARESGTSNWRWGQPVQSDAESIRDGAVGPGEP